MESSETDVRIKYLLDRISDIVRQYEDAVSTLVYGHKLEIADKDAEIRMLREQNNSLNEEIAQNYVPENGL